MKCGHYESMQIQYTGCSFTTCWDGRCLFCQVEELQAENEKLKKQAKAVRIGLEFLEKQAKGMQEHLCPPTE